MSLHQTVEMLKKFGLYIVAGILVLIILNLLAGLLFRLAPKKVIPPTVSFGKIPALNFPDMGTQSNPPTYILNTISGDFPVLPDRATIYPITQAEASLLSLRNFDTTISDATEFTTAPKPISETVYQWQGVKSPYRIITYNVFNQDLNVTSSYLTDPSFSSNLGPQDPTRAISDAQNFFTKINEFPTDIDPTKTQTTLYSIDPISHTLQPAISLGAAQIVQVDFFETDINQLPIYYPDPLHSVISALVGGDDVVAAQSIHKPIDQTTSATYPIKTAQQAFKELQDGKAYIAEPSNPPVDSINIRDISLGYYIGNGQQLYLMPIIVFQGDNGFYAYVSAITDDWIQ